MNFRLSSRRQILVLAVGLLAAPVRPLQALEMPVLHVALNPDCGCCSAWIDLMRLAGFRVTLQRMPAEALQELKLQNGISDAMAACHTAKIGGYLIEGHVPAVDILRLLETRPTAVGLAVPAMPSGAPGMDQQPRREAYAVHLILNDGTTPIFSRYDPA